MEQIITHACGHEQAHHFTGFADQQARKARWLQTTLCRTCFIAAKRSEEAAAAIEAGTAIAHLDLPQLHGSDRQVAWATTIRAQRLAAICTQTAADDAEGEKACLPIADAKWWIDHRDLASADLLAKARLYTDSAGPAVDRGPGTDMAQAA